MKQMSRAVTGFELVTKHTRKREFLDEMNLVIPWTELLALIAPHAPAGKTGRPPFATEVMLRIHLLQQFFGHSDPAMEEVLHDIPLYQEFARLDAGITRLPDENTILRFRHMLEEHGLGQQILATVNAKLIDRGLMLKTGTVVDTTLIDAPSSTKNDRDEQDPETHQTKKGNQWHFGMKAHVGADAESGLVHTVTTTAANANDITQTHALLLGQEEVVFADSGYRGVEKQKIDSGTAPMFALSNLWVVRKRILRGADMSAPAAGARAQKQAQLGRNGEKSTGNPALVSLSEHSRINSRHGGAIQTFS